MLHRLRVVTATIYSTILNLFFFFFNDTATTEIYTLSLHDALPIYRGLPRIDGRRCDRRDPGYGLCRADVLRRRDGRPWRARSEEHTSELQSRLHLVCRLLLEKKKKSLIPISNYQTTTIMSRQQLYT